MGKLQLQRSRHRLNRFHLRVTTDTGHRNTDIHSGTLVGVEQIRLQKDLTVRNRNHVGGNKRRDVVGFGFNNGQTRHRSRAHLVGELRTALQQTGVEVEDVAGEGFTTRWATQQQRHRTVGLGLLGEVIEND